MFKEIKWLRLTPDRQGRGGTKTGIHTFQQEPINDVRSLDGGHVYRGAWRREYSSVAYPTLQFSYNVPQLPLALHGYVYPSLTDPSAPPNVTVLSHFVAPPPTNASYILDVGVGNPARMIRTSLTPTPAVFQNIGGRCFVGEGTGEGMIFDDRPPAVHAQKNQNIGIGAPQQALQSTSGLAFNGSAVGSALVPNITGYGFAYIFNTHGVAGSILHTPDPDSQLGKLLVTDKITVSVANPSYTAITGAPPAPNFPATPPQSSNTAGPLAPPFGLAGATISCVSGSSIVTRSNAWPAGAGKVAGLAINFNGFSAVLGATDQDTGPDQFNIDGNLIALGANQAVIYGVYDGPTVVNVPFTLTGCEVTIGGAGSTNTLSVSNSAAPTLGYGQSTASSMVPVLVSSLSNDALWFTESASSKVGTITTAGVVTEFPTTSNPTYITAGTDGTLWTTLAGDKVARLTPGGTETGYPIPPPPAAAPLGVVVGPDGATWCVEANGDRVDRLSPSGTFTTYLVPTAGALCQEIASGADGNLWFTESGATNIGRITMNGIITEFNVGVAPYGITRGPDGNMWFTAPVANKVGMITPSGAVTLFAAGITAAAGLRSIVTGPDGNLWFAEETISKIGRITPAGVVTEFATTTPVAGPRGITVGPDSNLWFTEFTISKVGTMTTGGVMVAEYGAGITGTGLQSITSSASIHNLGNITLSGPGPSPLTPIPSSGPTYAYGWYDPETGHCSNISPLMTVAAPSPVTPNPAIKSYQNITPYFQIDSGAISYPSGIDATRFSHIVFFRTLSVPGSSTLYPIGSLNPFTGKVHPGLPSTRGSWNPLPLHGWYGLPNIYINAPPTGMGPNYWFDFSKDSDLLLSGGFRAPQFTNEKPRVILRGGIVQSGYPYALAYWDRRLWLVNTQEPDKILFSCDDAQCPLGVPTESFPPTNFLRLPSVDGRVIGMRTVGDMLLITTERWAYIIAGNNESNYRLLKVSSSMPGVGTYQMDEFPTYTGAEGEPTTLFYLGRDRVVYQWTVGGPVTPISQPIQDQLDIVLSASLGCTALLAYQFSRVHCVSAWGRRLVVVAPNPTGFNQGPSQVHFYDIDNRVWTEGFHPNATQNAQDGMAPMTTVYGLDVPVNELYSIFDPATSTIIVRSWLRDDTTGTPNYMTLTTFPMNFDGKKTRKQIVAMNLHATGGAWTGGIFVNEATAAISATFGAYPDPLGSIYAPIATPVDPGAQDIVVLGAQFSNLAPVVGYRFSFVVQKNADTNPAKIFALDVGFVDYEEPGDGEP